MLPGLIAALLLVGPGPLPQPSPIGLWETRSDATGEAQSLVRIYESGGQLFGRIERLLVSDGVPDRCTACKDERKGQPLVSLVIIRNLTASGDQYKGGDILDPENGKVYRCTLTLDASGSRLTVRGYIGISLFGRSQTWRRIE